MGKVNRKEITDAYLFLRVHNTSISDATLNFMHDVALREFDKISAGRECFSCVNDGLQGVYPSGCTGCGANGELKNFKLKQ